MASRCSVMALWQAASSARSGWVLPSHRPLWKTALFVKYRLIIDEFGGWELFQELLQTLSGIAHHHGADIATVASAAVLARPGVAAVIVGARDRSHLLANLKISSLSLGHDDWAQIERVLSQSHQLEGDVYTLERDVTGRHGSIMKYNLNRVEDGDVPQEAAP